ncbi:hypothetical protein INT47_001360 [Mucor saturninus]|uniref:PUM-HD domain-containing protein n=1 Tax=Mucor saturninus TaxID=64648 RepID=A0A8H7V493_9FUNG|nr:hypothetical protein INT47_001360 [Mucor saturninus]
MLSAKEDDYNQQQQQYASYSMTDQDIDDQIATINSLTISDQHPMDTMLDTSASTNATKSFRSIFPDNTAFTPQSTDRHLFRNNSFSIQPEYNSPSSSSNNLFMRYAEDGHQQLSRRESYPNLSTSYMANSNGNNYPDWHGYMQNLTTAEHQPSVEHNLFLMQQQQQQFIQSQQEYRKFSVDLASKRLDINRLTPSYSNPDLSSARRMGSLDSGTRLTRNNNSNTFDDFMDHPTVPIRQNSLFNNYSQSSSSFSNPPLLSPSIATTMNPLLVSHLMRQIQPTSISRPPSPTSRKNSMNQLRRTSSATTMNTSVNNNNEGDRFASIRLEDVVDEIYSLCKDQYGCRFFQKKLEEQKPDQRDLIFVQIYPHFVELMTDPFGNYLCQKLMEYCTDAQRTMIVEQVANAVITISLNMHGTRAVQRMIEFLTLPEQIEKTIGALSPNVVTLIKDINGNHVIQKCLHRLSSTDKQFIYDAVSENCIEVATHRHGCCVLQRCIDFSAESQKKQLVNEIIRHALTLVQDPYGNYVVQYVLELGDAHFSDQLIRQFIGHIGGLSVQKYSSNVMEKCIRVAEEDTRRHLIEEMVNRPQLEKLLKDSYANYVVQTALDFAEETQHQKLGDCIRPLLPAIRNTSYCKRIQGKLNRGEQQRQQPMQQTQPQYQQQQQQQFQLQQFQQQQQQQQGYNHHLGGSLIGGNNVHPLMTSEVGFSPTSPFVGHHPFSTTFSNP